MVTGNSSICCVFRQTPRAEWLPGHPVRSHKRPEAEQSFRRPDQRKENDTPTMNPCLLEDERELEDGISQKDNSEPWGEGIHWTEFPVGCPSSRWMRVKVRTEATSGLAAPQVRCREFGAEIRCGKRPKQNDPGWDRTSTNYSNTGNRKGKRCPDSSYSIN